MEIAYAGEAPLRVQGTSLYFFAHPQVKSKTCQPTFFQSGTPEEKCRKQAEAMWRCVQQDAAPRLDATPPPFSHPGVFPTEKGTDCQLDLLEQHRLELSTLESTPTGHIWGSAFFMAAD